MRQTQNASKKDNRKSILVIGLLLLLVAVIGFGGYTLSKYVTKKTATGSATVAKWGFTVTTDESKLFGQNYKYETNNSKVTAETANLTVKASDNKNKVAPGTTGSMTFTVKGSAEVAAQIKIEMTEIKDVVLKYKKNNVAGTDYAPVKWTLKKNDAAVKDAENVTLAVLAEKLNATTAYAAGADAINDTYTIEWVWAFEGTDGLADADQLDTLLGWTANNTTVPTDYGYTVETGTVTEIAFTLNISIEQVKEVKA